MALDESELPRLDELERRGRANEVPGLRRLGASELRELEPDAAGVAALHSPAPASRTSRRVARALADDLAERGIPVVTGVRGHRSEPARRALRIRHARGETRRGHAVFCAGLWADRLAVAAGAAPDPRIVPFRGGYLRLRPERRSSFAR